MSKKNEAQRAIDQLGQAMAETEEHTKEYQAHWDMRQRASVELARAVHGKRGKQRPAVKGGE